MLLIPCLLNPRKIRCEIRCALTWEEEIVFDGTQRKGLMGRMIQKLGLGADPMALTLVYPIASACYPKAIKQGEDGILEPKISVQEIRQLTEGFVDYGRGTLGDLYQKIWGVDGFEGYLEKFLGPVEDIDR